MGQNINTMKKLTEEEAAAIDIKPPGRRSVARMHLMNMKVGDIILLERKDWKQRRRKPSTYVKILGRNVGWEWSCHEAMDSSGWVIKRLK